MGLFLTAPISSPILETPAGRTVGIADGIQMKLYTLAPEPSPKIPHMALIRGENLKVLSSSPDLGDPEIE